MTDRLRKLATAPGWPSTLLASSKLRLSLVRDLDDDDLICEHVCYVH